MLAPGGSPVIAARCPKCRAKLEFEAARDGRIVHCTYCRAKFWLPGEAPPAEDEAAPAPVVEEAERPRRRKKRRRPPPIEEPVVEPGVTPEWVPPTIILALGLVLAVGGMAVTQGRLGFVAGLAVVGIHLVVTVPLSIAGLFISAPLLGITFGTIGMAVLKLAAINVLTLSIVLTTMFGGAPAVFGYTLAAPVGWLLFHWLFELEFNETLFALTVIGLIQFLANLTVAAVRLRGGR